MSKIAEFILVLVASFSVCLTLMAFFFFVLTEKYRKNLEKKQKEALNNISIGQDNERQRLSRDLHDEIGPMLASIVTSVDFLKTNDQEQNEILSEIKNTLKESIQDVRRISHDLMSQSLIKYGLVEGIKEMIQRRKNSKFKINFNSNSNGMEYSDLIKSNLYKINQELIYNTEKHSDADAVEIQINLNPTSRELIYLYSDNGAGNKDFHKENSGIGLKNIETRVDMMNGKIAIDMGKGFKAEIKLNY